MGEPGLAADSRDGGGNLLVLDLEPASRGVYGQIVLMYIEHPDRRRIALGFAELLDACVREWEDGTARVDDAVSAFGGFLPRARPWPTSDRGCLAPESLVT